MVHRNEVRHQSIFRRTREGNRGKIHDVVAKSCERGKLLEMKMIKERVGLKKAQHVAVDVPLGMRWKHHREGREAEDTWTPTMTQTLAEKCVVGLVPLVDVNPSFSSLILINLHQILGAPVYFSSRSHEKCFRLRRKSKVTDFREDQPPSKHFFTKSPPTLFVTSKKVLGDSRKNGIGDAFSFSEVHKKKGPALEKRVPAHTEKRAPAHKNHMSLIIIGWGRETKMWRRGG